MNHSGLKEDNQLSHKRQEYQECSIRGNVHIQRN